MSKSNKMNIHENIGYVKAKLIEDLQKNSTKNVSVRCTLKSGDYSFFTNIAPLCGVYSGAAGIFLHDENAVIGIYNGLKYIIYRQ